MPVVVVTRRPITWGSRALLRTILLIGLLAASVMGQQKSIPKEPLQVVDASTGQLIPELLLVPRYGSGKGISTLLGEGPSWGVGHDYLAKPFIYRSGTPFILKRPKSIGLAVPYLFAIGKGRSLYGVLLVARGYQPRWFTSLSSVGSERKIKLTPVSDDEWSSLLEKTLSCLEDVTLIKDDCSFWDVPTPCSLEIHYNKKERELVRAFLRGSSSVFED